MKKGRYKVIANDGGTFKPFSSKKEINEYIEEQIKIRGLVWRVGYLVRFQDNIQLEFVKSNGDQIK
jgi:hypothetical protein